MQSYFRGEDQSHTNQKCVGINELLKGIVGKEWEMLPQESTAFRSHNKVRIVNLCHEC